MNVTNGNGRNGRDRVMVNAEQRDRHDLVEGVLICVAGGITTVAGVHTLLEPQIKWDRGLWLRKILDPVTLGAVLSAAGLGILIVGIRKVVEYLKPELNVADMVSGIVTVLAGLLSTTIGALIVMDDFPDLGGEHPGHQVLMDLQEGHLHHYIIGLILFLIGLVITFLGGARIITPYLGTDTQEQIAAWKDKVKQQYFKGNDPFRFVDEGLSTVREKLGLGEENEVEKISEKIITAITA